ncbi:MAG TPA: NAD(P)/FAD-dependent oxidoreductase [Clostridiales bacterium]|nr:NAD(P)/FAD-dependent oxidoreductase [Clostridiales bacterium]
MLFKEIYDVIVVGGGPGGCVAAKECAEKGLSVLLLERHREIGVPVRCGEAVGKAGLLEFFSPDHPIVTQYVRKFKIRFIAPNGTALDLNHESEAAVLDRKIFDAGLGIAAATAGAAVMTGANVTGLLKSDGFVEGVEVELQGRRYKLKSKIVIGADGIESRVGRWAGIKTAPSFSDMESCVQYNISGKGYAKDRMDFYFGKDTAPTGYLWVFPKNDGTANIGVGVNGPASKEKKAEKYLNDFMSSYYPEASVIGTTCGGVVCSETLEKISGNGFMLVGDAAHQTNAVSGGGIINAMKAGRIAAEVAVSAISIDDVSANRLSEYEKLWNKKQGKANHKFYLIKRIIEDIEDETLNSITDKLNGQVFEKRTLINIFKSVLIKHPKLILDLPRLFT